jgi:peptide/nickel transport system permease protein
MSTRTTPVPVSPAGTPPVTDGGRGWLRRLRTNRSVLAGGVLLFAVIVLALVIPPIAHLDPYAVDPAQRLADPGSDHLLGTDTFGRDLLARVAAGAKSSLIVGGAVAVLSGVIGTAIGVLSSTFKVLDQLLMRVCDGLMAIPALLLAVALAAALGPSVPNLVVALTVVATPSVARLVRSRALAVMSETFVEASRAQGAGPWHIIAKHVLPNVLSVLAVQITFIFADAIITEAALSFLGAGVPTPQPSWGNILYDGKGVILQAPMMTVAASLALVLTVLALNLLGDGLRDVVDPRANRSGKQPGMLTRLIGARRPGPAAQDGI